jgi:hypothetical protein
MEPSILPIYSKEPCEQFELPPVEVATLELKSATNYSRRKK